MVTEDFGEILGPPYCQAVPFPEEILLSKSIDELYQTCSIGQTRWIIRINSRIIDGK